MPVAVAGRAAAPAVTHVGGVGQDTRAGGGMARVLADWMVGAGRRVALADVAHTLNHHRARHARFATVCARDRAQAVAGLRALAAGRPADGRGGCRTRGRVGRARCSCIRVRGRSGRGWAGGCWPMSRRSRRRWPSWSRCSSSRWGSRCGGAGRREPVAGIDRIQPVLVGVQLALTALWRATGWNPDAVIGHSMGEVDRGGGGRGADAPPRGCG